MNFSGFPRPYLEEIKRGIPKGGGRPDGFNAAKFGAYMPKELPYGPDDGNEVAMDFGVVKRAGSFLDRLPRAATSAPGVDPRLQYAVDAVGNAVFGRGGGGAPSRPGQLSPGEEAWRQYARGNDLKTFAQGGSGALDREEQKRRLLRGY